jgi:Cupredoxin-like domain
MKRHLLPLVLVGVMMAGGVALAADAPAFELTLKNHEFSPATLAIPANKQVKLTVRNEDPTPAEFESHDFHAEQIVTGGGQTTLYIGPLSPGTYGFFDDFHHATTGKIVVK